MSYIVKIENTPYQFEVMTGESVLQAALRQNIDMPWGCGDGMCGVCMGQVVKGEINYPGGPPLALFEEDAEQGKGLFCVGHPCSNLVLNVPEMNS
ncbi:MAG: 2Fe-2S iron-sulfur cluster-binding protein [Thiolinea sp.]